MKKFVCIFFTGILMYSAINCQTPGKNSAADGSGSLELVVEPGEHWQGKMKVFIFSVKKTPQMAAWIEDRDGRYVATITVTSRSAKGKWRGSGKNKGRPETLPVWYHRQHNSSLPDDIDAASRATPNGAVRAVIDSGSLVKGNTYSVFLEVNHSYDYNDFWTEDNSGVNGQPSLVYHAQFTAGQPGRTPLVPAGHGSVDGLNGSITTSLENFTSALDIVKNIHIIEK